MELSYSIMASCKPNLLFLQIWCVSAGVLLLAMMASTAQGNEMSGPSRRMLAVCPDICFDVSYTTCTSSGDEELQSYCNCCFLKNALPNAGNCTLHLKDGTEVSCSWSNCRDPEEIYKWLSRSNYGSFCCNYYEWMVVISK